MDTNTVEDDVHQSEPTFNPYNDNSQQTYPITASPQRSINLQSPEKSQEISQAHLQIIQLQDTISQQELQHQNSLNMYTQIVKFYDQNLLNLKNLIISKENELQNKNQKIQSLQHLIEQIQSSFQSICLKYESENSELMQRYMQTIEEFNKISKQKTTQNPEVILEIVQLKEKLVEISQRKSQLELTLREIQLKQNHDQKIYNDCRQENQNLRNELNQLTKQMNQKSVSPSNFTINQDAFAVKDQQLVVNKKLNKSEILLKVQYDESNLMQNYSNAARSKASSSESKDMIGLKLQNLHHKRSKLENDLNRFPLHGRNLSEKRQKIQLEESLQNVEDQILTTKQEMSNIF